MDPSKLPKPETFTITIDSILGGLSATTHFSGKNQFRASLGIDPAQPFDDLDSTVSTMASGLIRPVASEKFSGSTIASSPLFIRTNPKDANVYVYDARGSAYTIDATLTTVTALADGGTLTNSLGNGCDYYDNYMYFLKNTDVNRYGPLNGAAAFDGDFWTGNLAKAALTNTTYPTTFKNKIQLPNHPTHRHSDGRLYIGDVVGNQGTIHFIKTTKVAVEGDTDNGSTASALTLGYGLWPTALEGYGSDLAFAVYEGSNTGLRQKQAKVGFWDTTSSSFGQITWDEFPDSLITAMKNRNGTLFVASGNYQTQGFRISYYAGGYTFKELFYSETGEPPLIGAMDAILDRVLMGSHTNVPEGRGCVYATGLQKTALGNGIFNIMGATGVAGSTSVTAVCFADAAEMGFYTPIIGWSEAGEGSTGASFGLDKQGTTYSNAPSVLWSQLFRIGRPFKLTKMRIPLVQKVAAGHTLTPLFYLDNGLTTTSGTVINSTNYPNSEIDIVQRFSGLTGKHNFWLELRWTGASLLTVELPITIKGEIIPDTDS